MKRKVLNIGLGLGAICVQAIALTSCGGSSSSSELTWKKGTSSETIVKEAAAAKSLGNWGIGNEYEIYALLQKYGQKKEYVSQAFTMDSFDDGTIALASAMTYNELGLVKNSYDGAFGYGDKVGYIDMNDEGVAMLEDNIFCTKEYAQSNPNTVKAFLYATMKGWEYACEHTNEAAEIVYNAGSSVSMDHQKYMASEMAKLCTTNTKGETVPVDGTMYDDSMQQTLTQAKEYITLADSTAQTKLNSMTLDDIRDTSFIEEVKASEDGDFGELEDKDLSIQLKWLPQAQFMGYYVAKEKGYYTEVGFEKVTITSGGGDISETTTVQNGGADFGQTWVSNLIAADAAGSTLLQVGQIAQRSGIVLVYKYKL